MRVYENGVYRDLTPEEVAEIQTEQEKQEKEYWTNISYEEAVNAEIRKQYTESGEFAILRQKDEKPEEYAKYYSYCEECKAYVRAKKEEYS